MSFNEIRGRQTNLIMAGIMCIWFTACGAAEEAEPVAYDYKELMQPITVSSSDIYDEAGQSEYQEQDGTSDIDMDEQDNVIEVTISAAGDVTLGNYLNQNYSYSFDQTYEQTEDKKYFFENVYDIFSADDFTVVNLEGPLTDSGEIRQEKEYVIKGKPEYAQLLKYGAIEAAGLANNHILDYKEQGLLDTVQALDEQGIAYAYDSNVGIYNVGEVKIGYVAVSQVSRGNAMEKTLQNGIETLQEEEADIILVLCHWGIEREFYPEEYQRYLGKLCIDWGADIVLGSHPHVLQGIEEYNGKFIVYSMGNFCFGGNRNPADKDSMIFQQTFTFVDGEKQSDANIRVIPCSISSVSERNNYQPTPSVGSEAERIIDRINEYSSDFGVEFDYDGYLK
ncbi:MAG: CapA family protein [Lachnospiraceae bacterium]|nr:CapA family protein [Lachnospiraceae bacterium]